MQRELEDLYTSVAETRVSGRLHLSTSSSLLLRNIRGAVHKVAESTLFVGVTTRQIRGKDLPSGEEPAR